MVDAVSTALIGIGLGLSPHLLLSIGTLLVVGYLVLSINVYLESQALGRFSIGYGFIGPTEVRLLLIGLNTALALGFAPAFERLGASFSPLDLFGLGAVAAMVREAVDGYHRAHAHRMRPLPHPQHDQRGHGNGSPERGSVVHGFSRSSTSSGPRSMVAQRRNAWTAR